LPAGTGDHVYVRVKKRGLTTRDVVTALSRAARVQERDIGYAGLKDKHAVTIQWFSLPRSPLTPDGWQLPEGVEVLEVSRHNNKLRTGHLVGNRFQISLAGLDNSALVRAQAIRERLSNDGLFNFFGEQRFGAEGNNLAYGLAWLRGEARLPRSRERFLTKFLPSAIQSDVFNRYVILRAALGLDHLLPGEVVRLEGTGSMFVVEDPDREQSRFSARDIHLTGPMVGPKMRKSERLAKDLEERALRESGLDEEDVDRLGRHVPGARRDVLVFPKNLDVSWGDDRLVVSFELPAGGYATVLMREFTRSERHSEHPAEAPPSNADGPSATRE
jgi:tRNA pseudouridine13 synthase